MKIHESDLQEAMHAGICDVCDIHGRYNKVVLYNISLLSGSLSKKTGEQFAEQFLISLTFLPSIINATFSHRETSGGAHVALLWHSRVATPGGYIA